jgi:H+-transporting ATPase
MSTAAPYSAGGFAENDLFFYAALASREENHDPIEQPIFETIDQHSLRTGLDGYQLEKFIPFDPVSKRTEAILLAEDGSELDKIHCPFKPKALANRTWS